MLKKLLAGTAAIAVLGFAGSAMAQTNPWAPGQTTVPVTVTVEPMVELFTNTDPVPLSIVDAGENQGSDNAIGRTLTHLHNVDVDVSAEIDADIPDDTQFHILIEPASTWSTLGSSGATKVISWRREGGTYSPGATGGHPNQATSGGVGAGNAVVAFSEGDNSGNTTGSAPTVKTVQYFADSRNIMAAQASSTFNVVWTIAPQ